MTAVQGDGYERYGLNLPGFTLDDASNSDCRLAFDDDSDATADFNEQ
jgi:hypothetical protein